MSLDFIVKHAGLIAFIMLTFISFLVQRDRSSIVKKSFVNWVTDISSLLAHFLVIPAAQIIIVFGFLKHFVPEWKGVLPSSFLLSLLIYVVIDYAWYWNHRIFHAQTPLWNLHKTHHSPEHIDVFVTSRNALITHFLMVYFWLVGIAFYTLSDPWWFLMFSGLGLVVNFWGHTSFALPCNSWINKLLSLIVVTPREHLWHHSRENPHCNFGTVFVWWDKIHGTAYCKTEIPETYGDDSKKTVWNQLIWPF